MTPGHNGKPVADRIADYIEHRAERFSDRAAATGNAPLHPTAAGRQDTIATVLAEADLVFVTAGFGTLDLGATWRYAQQQSLRLAIRNVADKAYHEHLAEGVSGQEIQATGRSVQVSWQGSF